jgi:hypothetical protein
MGAKKASYVVCVRNVKGTDSLETLSVDGKNENSYKEIGWDGMEWIDLA